jgi:RNA polymerase sigma-70 factor, ECF subfamily
LLTTGHIGENGLFSQSVYLSVMLATARGPQVLSLEALLTTGRDAAIAEQFLRLAHEELDRAYRIAGLILGNRQEAEDATQDALLRAWQSSAGLRDAGRFQQWFDRILINVCKDRLRQRGAVRLIELAGAVTAPSGRDPFRSVADSDEVAGAMASLDDELRIVIVLHYWADLTLDAVAERVGWPVGTVKSRLHRGLALMRERLGMSSASEVG